MILKTIENDLHDEFSQLKRSLKKQLEGDLNIDQKITLIEEYVPKEIMQKSELLMDTLLNYRMDKAKIRLEGLETELQNKFYEADFRNKTNIWVAQDQNKLNLYKNIFSFSSDPSWIYLSISGVVSLILCIYIVKFNFDFSLFGVAGFITFFMGSLCTSIIIMVITYSFFAYKYNKIIKNEVKLYLEYSEQQLLAWLKSCDEEFSKNFNEFCTMNGLDVEE